MASDIVGVKQKMQHFTTKCCIFSFLKLPLLCCGFWIFKGKSITRYAPDNIFYYKGVFNGNYTANPKQGRTHGFQDVL